MNDENDFFDDVIDDEADFNDSSEAGFGGEDDDEEEEEEPIDVRTAILSKNGMVALLSLKTYSSGGQIVRVDPRQSLPTAQTYEDGASALRWFKRSLMTSRKNGWTEIYEGEPLFG